MASLSVPSTSTSSAPSTSSASLPPSAPPLPATHTTQIVEGPRFGAVSWPTFYGITSKWHCLQSCLHYSKAGGGFGGGFATHGRADVHVLDCGHFICHNCKDRHARAGTVVHCLSFNNVTGSNCSHGYDPSEIDNLPLAVYVSDIIANLYSPAFTCPSCPRTTHGLTRVPLSMVLVCTTCLTNKPKSSVLCGPCLTGPVQGSFTTNAHVWHDVRPTYTLLNDPSVVAAHQAHNSVANAANWMYSMADGVELQQLLKTILGCRQCRVEYGPHTSLFPVMVDCGCFYCSNCAGNLSGTCVHGCSKPLVKSRRPLDIQQLVGREISKHVLCTECSEYVPPSYAHRHKYEGTNKKLCDSRTCLDCRFVLQPYRNHRHTHMPPGFHLE